MRSVVTWRNLVATLVGLLVGVALSRATGHEREHSDDPVVPEQPRRRSPSTRLPSLARSPQGQAVDPGTGSGSGFDDAVRTLRASFINRWGRPPIAAEGMGAEFYPETVVPSFEEWAVSWHGEVVDVECEWYPCVVLVELPLEWRDEDPGVTFPDLYPDAQIVSLYRDRVGDRSFYRAALAVVPVALGRYEERFVHHRASILEMRHRERQGSSPP